MTDLTRAAVPVAFTGEPYQLDMDSGVLTVRDVIAALRTVDPGALVFLAARTVNASGTKPAERVVVSERTAPTDPIAVVLL